MEIQIYTKKGQKRCVATSIEYTGEWMSECFVTFDVYSPTPIEFEIGDYLDYRGERFVLHYEPSVTKVAESGKAGNAYRYEGIKFQSLAEEMVNADFLDYVLNDNNVHYSGLSDFSFYAETVQDLADRLQANMDRYCEQNGIEKWEFAVEGEAGGETGVNVSVTNLSCFDALTLVQSEFGLNYIIRGRKVTIGTSGMPADHIFKMGKDGDGNPNGLYEFSRDAETDQKTVTRLRVYGSSRNLPRRYYNKLTDADGVKMVPDNMAVQRLMLPDFPEKTLDPYIDSKNITALGVREDTIYFDGSGDLEEIYPSIEESTAEELKASGIETTAEGRLDEIAEGSDVGDDGVGEEKDGEITIEEEYFTVRIKDVGFEIMDYLTDETPRVSFKSGMLGGREFEILTGQHKPVQNEDGTWTLTLARAYDDAIDLFFPYKQYNAKTGDRFVLLGIDMPDSYIKMSSQRLLERAKEYLSKNDYARSTYTPKVDEVFMAMQHHFYETGMADSSLYLDIKEGDLMMFEDGSLNIGLSSIFIDKLTIKEGDGAVPTYEITLREEKTVGTLQRIQNQIDSLKNGNGNGSGYNTEQIKSLIQTIGNTLFLSKVRNDRTPHDLSVGGRVTAEGDIGSLNPFLDLMRGWGWQIDKFGNAEVESIRVRSYMEVLELIVNRLSAIQGDQLFTEGDTIEECTLNTDGTYTLKLKEEWDGYFTAQYENNVLKGIYNNITNSVSGEGTTKINGATYYTSWMRVVGIDAANNIIRVTLYEDKDVPAGRNFPPCEKMKIARWGNSGAATDEKGNRTEYGRRQSCFEISSTEGRITQYINVTKPIVDATNVALCIGRCPEFLDGVNQDIHAGDIVIYIQKVLAEQVVSVKWKGTPVPTVVYRGDWSEDGFYYDGHSAKDENGEDRYTEMGTLLYEQSSVTHWGCLWVCNSRGTKRAPSWTGTDWTLMSGIDTMRLEFDTTQDSVWADNPEITLGVICTISTQDMTNDPSISYRWIRQSWHGDTEDTASDELWNNSHRNIGPSHTLVAEDFNYAFGKPPDKLLITVTATLLDAEGTPVVNGQGNKFQQSIQFEL